MKQVIKILVRLARHPVLFAHANLRLIIRGLCYLAQNPDLAWARDLLSLPPSERGLSISIVEKDKPIFSLTLDHKNPHSGAPGQEILVDVEIFNRIHSALIREKHCDAFFIAGREILHALSRGLIKFSPFLPETKILTALDPEELLCKFGPRFGLSRNNPVRFGLALQGLRLALLSPITRWRRKKHCDTVSD